jgi:hypothetical protein
VYVPNVRIKKCSSLPVRSINYRKKSFVTLTPDERIQQHEPGTKTIILFRCKQPLNY